MKFLISIFCLLAFICATGCHQVMASGIADSALKSTSIAQAVIFVNDDFKNDGTYGVPAEHFQSIRGKISGNLKKRIVVDVAGDRRPLGICSVSLLEFTTAGDSAKAHVVFDYSRNSEITVLVNFRRVEGVWKLDSCAFYSMI